MGLQIDWGNKLVLVTSPTTAENMQVVHDFIEDAMATPRGITEADILQPEGKIEDPNNPGIFSQIIIVLSSLWQIQFWGGSGYTRLYGGKLVGGVSDQPIKASGTAGDITVLESPVDGVTVVSGSGVTAQDKIDIIDGVWADADAVLIKKLLYNKVTKSGDIVTIYEDDEITIWKQFNLASGGRVEI